MHCYTDIRVDKDIKDIQKCVIPNGGSAGNFSKNQAEPNL